MPADEALAGESIADAPGPTAEELAFDEYLERALGGAAPDPVDFARARGGASPSLLERLARIHRRSARAPWDAGSLPFERLGEFRLVRRLGGGGMGLVFEAEQESLGRRVALKLVRPELQGSAVAAERFHREALAIASLRHPGIVGVFAAGEERGVRYLAMELVEGSSLDELAETGELARTPTARKVRWTLQLARALEYAHGRGVVHRDVKPSNVRITPDDRALLVDFGLARITGSGQVSLTESFAGSPSYASPEQIADAGAVDARTDVYSLGVTLYQCLTGTAPFAGESVDQVFHRILSAEPVPPRKLAPSIPRDLETVVLQAMERDPARRYPSAGALADDLEAVLELRPIRGRPPGVLERLRRAARRHPALATALASGAVALAVLAGALFAQASVRRSEQRGEARRAVAAARAKVAEYQESRRALAGLLAEVEELRRDQAYEYLDERQYALLDANEERLDEHKRAWEATFYEVLDLLRHAERQDPLVEAAEAVRADLHMERLLEAREARDWGSAELQRDLVLAHDADGRWSRELSGELELTLRTEPPGAEVHLFLLEDASRLVEGGEPRQVPVPFAGGALPVPPGTWTLRVREGAGELLRGDHLIEIAGHPIEGAVLMAEGPAPLACGDRLAAIDGQPVRDLWAIETLGAPAKPGGDGEVPARRFEFEHAEGTLVLEGTSLAELGVRALTAAEFAADRARPAVAAKVLRYGELLEVRLPPGLDVRASAAPAFLSPASSLGRSPIEARRLPSASYLAIAALDGYEEHCVAIPQGVGRCESTLRLHPLGSAPEGFVRVEEEGGYWIQEREVTSAEYLEFVNDPSTLAEIDATGALALVPRLKQEPFGGPVWERSEDGRFRLPEDWSADLPVIGISWGDAQAYARWRTERDRARGLEWAYALPTYLEYAYAGVGRLGWNYSWGTRFRAKWSHTCFARPSARLGRVMQFPVDRSPFGVYDLCGGVFEWLDHWYDEGRGQRGLGGGAWGHSDPEVIKATGGFGAPPEVTSASVGMRLVARTAREDPR
ncbi:MAG TPA: bifunctional serine/threonine-protein kinase/formylglycine-generating enzyme family protein [Planctomycetota bacterium]|nr:bifunctional serine/threonine-protein kinase/formylglycine-generating enzyme family protein [Planctomycetota bacterium]